MKGNFSVSSDRLKIEELYKSLIPYFKVNTEGYEGGYDSDGNYVGKGVYRFHDGGIYEGDFVAGRKEGKGLWTYSSGSTYEGDFKSDLRTGWGLFRGANGITFEV